MITTITIIIIKQMNSCAILCVCLCGHFIETWAFFVSLVRLAYSRGCLFAMFIPDLSHQYQMTCKEAFVCKYTVCTCRG